ncbi:MAG: hypothetical protein L0154_09745, partial [Chloroflexi bacterium]|nr:hypothetical protein [Chloroflexota bacterium]
ALNVLGKPRIEWDAFDLRYGDYAIEVKAAGYVQSWHQKQQASKISFDIAPKFAWDAATNSYSQTVLRSSHCYVFCLHLDIDMTEANPLDVSRWEFYVVATTILEKQFDTQKTVTLSRLKRLIAPVAFAELKETIDQQLKGK